MDRIKKLQGRLGEYCIDGMFLITEQNIRYLTGFTGSDSYILITQKGKYFITDGRYTEQAEKECPEFTVVNWRKSGHRLSETVKKIAEKLDIKRLGFEKDRVTFELYSNLNEDVKNMELVPVKGMVESLRYQKDYEEIGKIKRACEISENALDKVLDTIKPGLTEKDIAAELEYQIKKQGADGVGFDTILVSGKRTSLLHGKPSNKKIEYGDFVLIDFGAMYEGYICDMTRTFVVGKADSEQRKLYYTVKEALEYAMGAVKAKASCRDVSEKAREIVERSGYLDYYYPNLGHGVGLVVHEEPFMGPVLEYTLEENCVVTIEPGVYIPDWGGVRIEDLVLVTKDSHEILTKSSKELIVL